MRFPLCMGYGTSDRWGLWASFHIDLYINLQNFKMAIGFDTQFVTRFSQFKSELHSRTQFKIIHILELNISGLITNGKPQCIGHLQFFFLVSGPQVVLNISLGNIQCYLRSIIHVVVSVWSIQQTSLFPHTLRLALLCKSDSFV